MDFDGKPPESTMVQVICPMEYHRHCGGELHNYVEQLHGRDRRPV